MVAACDDAARHNTTDVHLFGIAEKDADVLVTVNLRTNDRYILQSGTLGIAKKS